MSIKFPAPEQPEAASSAPVSQIRTTSVDLGGLMTVLGKHLYSTPTVALRELVQNAHDSIIRRRPEASGCRLPMCGRFSSFAAYWSKGWPVM